MSLPYKMIDFPHHVTGLASRPREVGRWVYEGGEKEVVVKGYKRFAALLVPGLTASSPPRHRRCRRFLRGIKFILIYSRIGVRRCRCSLSPRAIAPFRPVSLRLPIAAQP